jgi:essential nuclear protein 1
VSETSETDIHIGEDEAEYVYEDEEEFPGNKSWSLADIILQKLHEKELNQNQTEMQNDSNSLPEKVQEVYASVGTLLSLYRSGKLPKAVKVLPHLKNWEEILVLTHPEEWTPAGTYAVAKIFSSNLNAKLVQRFFTLVLLEKCRMDIQDHDKLNFHLYNALKKSLFKPAAYFKGLILPLLQSNTCTTREAVIFSSVLGKMSVPAIHSAAALLRITELPYSVAVIIFVKQILNKKYAFPESVIEKVFQYFIDFGRRKCDLTVVWHQALLTFVQRYKAFFDLSKKEAIFELIRSYRHPEISAEIQRELL